MMRARPTSGVWRVPVRRVWSERCEVHRGGASRADCLQCLVEKEAREERARSEEQ